MKLNSLLKTVVNTTVSTLCVTTLATGLAATNASADKALIIGINHYPNLNNATLDGCINDADVMCDTLKKWNFETTVLTDGEATLENILTKLKEIKSQIKTGERFVFYFAGHGTNASDLRTVLLTSNASENFDNVLDKDTLQRAINAIPASSRTVILDACHSEGLFRAKGITRPHGKIRFHPMKRDGSKRIVLKDTTDETDKTLTGTGMIGFTACARSQYAAELKDDKGKDHGAFTYYFTSALEKAQSENRTNVSWEEVVTQVSANVAEQSDQLQTPVFTPTERRTARVFDSKSVKDDKKDDKKPERSLWEDYTDNKTNSEYLKVTAEFTDEKVIRKGEKVTFRVSAGNREGYLIVLNKDFSNKIFLFAPEKTHTSMNNSDLEELLQKAYLDSKGTRIFTGEMQDIGTERMKFILFRSKEDAKALISQIPTDGLSAAALRSLYRRVKPINISDDSWDYFTALLEFEVTLDGKSTPANSKGGLAHD